MWNNSTLTQLGECILPVHNPARPESRYKVRFQVVKEDLQPLLSRSASEGMDLIKIHHHNIHQINGEDKKNKNEWAEKFPDVFDKDRIGKFPGKVRFKVNQDIVPTQCSARSLPITKMKPVEEHLKKLVKDGVIVPEKASTQWCSQISVQTKENGDIRLCIDPRPLNKALEREIYPLPIMNDILHKFSGAKHFTKIDLRHGYWHCELSDETSYLTTFITPWGRYRWKRMPFGTKVSSEIFARKLREAIEGLEGVEVIADDGTVHGRTQEEHDKRLQAFLERCQQQGIVLNLPKCEFDLDEIVFNGHIVSKDGLKPDPKTTEAVLKMKAPEDAQGIRRLQGMVNWIAPHIPRLSDIMEPIRRLTKEKVSFVWGPEQEEAFRKVKELITSAPILAYFDETKDLVIQCDSSKTGIGAVLMQEGKPIEYGSKALTENEIENRHPIEKETMAICYATKRWHTYCFGRPVTVYSDHQPLYSITRKPLCRAPERLQSMMIYLLKYDLTVEYKKGKEMFVSDTLSRAHLKETKEQKFDSICNVGATTLLMRPARLEELKKKTEDDQVTKKVKETIQQGWPETKRQADTRVAPYFSFRDELTVTNGIIYKGERVVIPREMRKDILHKLHKSHLAGDSMIRRARTCVFWPGMAPDIREMAERCEACQTYRQAQTRETLMPMTSDYPWEKVGIDLMTWEDRDYLITTDYFSGYWEADRVTTSTSQAVIRILKQHFARYGTPTVVISDNGRQFVSEEFCEFARKWDFNHNTSSPGHAQANGMAESSVKAAKRLMKKCRLAKTDMFEAILELRNTPEQHTDTSPVQKFLNRMTRSSIPTTGRMLEERSNTDKAIIKEKKKHQKYRQKANYDKNKRDLPPLEEGERVRMQPFKLGGDKWNAGTVKKRVDERSYEVDMDKGGTLRRNRVHLYKTADVRSEIGDLEADHDQTPDPKPDPPKTPPPKDPIRPSTISQDPNKTPLPIQGPRRSSRVRETSRRLTDYAY